MNVTRLFDILDYRKETQRTRPVFCAKENGEWHKITIDEYIEKVNNLSYALLKAGVKRQDKIALISSDRPEWNYLDMAVQQIGAILVPIYPTISEEDYHFILENAEVKMLFLENAEMIRKVSNFIAEIKQIEGIYTFVEPKAVPELPEGMEFNTLSNLLEIGRNAANPEEVAARRSEIQPRDCATMIYTSGTTGHPKGVMLCHENILTCVFGVQNTPEPYFSRAMSFLPLCHIYERMMNYFYQYIGYETYYAESLGRVVEDLKIAQPHIMTAVPRFVEKLYDGIYRKGEKLKGMKRKIFFWAIDLAKEFQLEGNSTWFDIRRKIADRLVYKTIRESCGGHLEIIVSGGSAMQPKLAKFFTCVGMKIYEGYGLTETSPVIAVSSKEPHGIKLGTAGLPLPGVEVIISDANNEILCRGKNVMLGYYKNPEATAQAIDEDGWFHTGDTGMIEPEGQVRITGRTKTMFKTSMGKYVNPEVLEERFKESPFIHDMMVVGENQKFAAALIIPDFDMLKDWQKRHGIKCETRDEMIADKATLERYQAVIDKYNTYFGATEQIKRFKILNDSWDINNGCLTPTLKLKRGVISQRCQTEIDALFL